MPMGFSDEEVRRAMLDMFGDDGSSLEWGDGGPAPKRNMPAPPGPGGGGILDSDPRQLQAPAVDWSNLDPGLSGADRTSLLGGGLGQPVAYHLGGGGSNGFSPASNIAPMGSSGTPSAAQLYSALQTPPVNLSGSIYGSNGPAPNSGNGAAKDEVNGGQAAAALNAELARQGVTGTVYPDFAGALGAWSDAAQPFQKQFDTELNSNIYAVPGGWQIGPASSNGSRCSQGGRCTTSPLPGDIPSNGLYWGYIHTHPTNFGGLDYADESIPFGDQSGSSDAYVSLPNGQIMGWNSGMQKTDDTQPGSGQYIIRPRTR